MTPAEQIRKRDEESCADKRKFLDKTLAKNRAKQLSRGGVKIRVYECAVCHAFHLTHTDPAEQREKRRLAREAAGTVGSPATGRVP
jgi:hypothetical protein